MLSLGTGDRKMDLEGNTEYRRIQVQFTIISILVQ
jgi:hypothetical protein